MRNIRSVGVSSPMLVAMKPDPKAKMDAIWSALSDEWTRVQNGKQDLTELKRLYSIAMVRNASEDIANKGVIEAIRWREEALKEFGSYRGV